MTKAREMIQDLPSVHVGDDLAALAQEVGLDPDALLACVARYNELCEAAAAADPDDTTADADFHKKAIHMHAIGDGPYWLCETAACLATTVGGLAVNANAQVCRKGGGVIGGLYATGCDAGSPWGDSYDVEFLGGSCTAWAVISGRIAAMEAVAGIGA